MAEKTLEEMRQAVAEIREKMAAAAREAGRDPAAVQLCAACKTRTVEEVIASAALPIDLFGENHVQELVEKTDANAYCGKPGHFIGHLQTNKVRQIADKVTMIQSLDSLPLAREIEKQCAKLGKKMDCLVEVNIGSELTKSGVSPEALPEFLEEVSSVGGICVRGLMSIPPVCENDLERERYFSSLYKLFVDIGQKKIDNISMDFLSMGMSDDYLLAIKHGSSLVRIGTALFGRRAYAGHQ